MRVRWQTDAVTTTTPPTLANFREVGGPGFQAGRTRTVYRSNTEDVPATAYPVVLETVVDLRRGDEVAALAHPLRAAAGYRNVPLFDPAAGEESAPDALELRDQYVDWLVRHRATMLLVFRALAETEGDVLVCCSAGKDRTGVVSALLARLWGRTSTASARTTPRPGRRWRTVSPANAPRLPTPSTSTATSDRRPPRPSRSSSTWRSSSCPSAATCAGSG